MLGGALVLILIIFLGIIGSLIPIGNERSTVRRLPWITFAIIAISVMIYYVTLPSLVGQNRRLITNISLLKEFVDHHQEMLGDEQTRVDLKEIGIISDARIKEVEKSISANPGFEKEYKVWWRGREASRLREQLDTLLSEHRAVTGEHLIYLYGLAPGANFRIYQPVTSAFFHAGIFHLFFNMLFFFAVAFSLEDLWGRSTFAIFYLMGAAFAVIPALISPLTIPAIGASGAVSAAMGAFLVRLPKTRVKLFILPSIFLMLIGRRSVTVMVQGYVYMIAFLVSQILQWWLEHETGQSSGVLFSAHIAGFLFGAAFALIL